MPPIDDKLDRGHLQVHSSASPADDDDAPRLPADQGFEAVTPGFHPSSYHSSSQRHPVDAPSYFSHADPRIERPLGDLPEHPDTMTGDRPSVAGLRRQSLTDIRALNPELSLSGNIISATFTIPHSFAYRKSGEWVR